MLGLLDDGSRYTLADLHATSIALSYQMENGSLKGVEKWFIEVTSQAQFRRVAVIFHNKVWNRLRDYERGQAQFPSSSLLEIAKFQAKRELDDRA